MVDPKRARSGRPAALTDELTGLANRLHLSVFLQAGWGSAMRGSGLAVVRFVVDDLERIAKNRGRGRAEDALLAVAALLADRTPRMDLCARCDDDGFVAVLLDCPIEQARAFAEDVRWRCEEIEFEGRRLTVSAGVSAISTRTESPEALLAAAGSLSLDACGRGGNVILSDDDGTDMVGPLDELTPDKPEGGELPSLDGRRVLVVDDEGDTLRATRRLLERLGCTVVAAGSSREALATVTASEPIDVIVTDIVMPDMSGFALVDLSKKVRADVPVLYISGHPQEEVYWGGAPGARSAFLGKPMEIRQLHAAIAGLVQVQVREATEVGTPGADNSRKNLAARGAERPRSVERRDRVLIVDDDDAVLQSMQRLLRQGGLAVPLSVSDPTKVVEAMTRERIDLLILDLHMPTMSGFDVLESLAPILRNEPYLPILVLTADDNPAVRQRALGSGAMDFLLKPFDPLEVRARVRNLLTTRSLYRQLADRGDELETRVLARTAELADTRAEILHRLARAGEYRDDTTGRHAERVGLLSSLIAAELGLGLREVELIRRTAPLHDIGKIGVPDSVLQKPGRLTDAEFEMMKTHTTIGQQILGGSRNRILEVASSIAVAHHERWDGNGYPHGLGGEDIPLEARIVTVADVFDSLTHTRPYKRAFPLEEALAEIDLYDGTQFDPRVVRAFMTIRERVGLENILELADPLDPLRDTRELSYT